MWVPGLQMGFVLVCSQTRVVTDGLGGRAVSRLQTRSLLSLLLPLYKRLWSGQVGSTSEFTTPSFPWLKYFVIKKDQFAGLGYSCAGTLMQSSPRCPLPRPGAGGGCDSREENAKRSSPCLAQVRPQELLQGPPCSWGLWMISYPST